MVRSPDKFIDTHSIHQRRRLPMSLFDHYPLGTGSSTISKTVPRKRVRNVGIRALVLRGLSYLIWAILSAC
ncbi:hypothetical protein BDV24DRAFT_124903 [Aspergillus arachidicola]|uniref:Uncharacterized protein n=1 Tax=Aspergillus arachidicola TaxID=656916 RepID=A0A5N6YK18_9EURO|nr:hypothetical protein BDV24DRAFT_124903 [Aspergillus arachidicola]